MLFAPAVLAAALTFISVSTVQAHFDGEAHEEFIQDDFESVPDWLETLGCVSATQSQLAYVNQGNQKREAFLAECRRQTNSSSWCAQLIRPNPSSINTFRCTYGSSQTHQLIHPNESTWRFAITGVKVLQELAAKGIEICQIYNWWRPEPYNQNVGGAAGRHPYGTSLDVRFCSNSQADRAFDELCKIRRRGTIRALGHYGTSGLHIGVGDSTANTWGRSCP